MGFPRKTNFGNFDFFCGGADVGAVRISEKEDYRFTPEIRQGTNFTRMVGKFEIPAEFSACDVR